MHYTIDQFWKPRLNDAKSEPSSPLPGWCSLREPVETFVEAPLTPGGQFDGTDNPHDADLILVSAPGAVGKSTLAQQIAFHTQAVYLNLANAGPVGANTLTGGLVRSGLLTGWQQGDVALLIDGLDEARLRVTPEAFDEFLRDVAQLARNRALPTVLFGRTRAIEDAWLVLDDAGAEPALLEIGYYDHDGSNAFVRSRIVSQLPKTHTRRCGSMLLVCYLDGLREQADSDGDRFSGYAPVLVAVAERVARDSNPSALIQGIKSGHRAITLQGVVDAILDREHRKLRTLPFKDGSLAQQLYTKKEQLDHLVAREYDAQPLSPATPMTNRDRHIYEQALKSWVPEHPFLGGGDGSRSPVFDAVVASHALTRPDAARAALEGEIGRGAAANPFLSVFYPKGTDIPPEHIGIVYSSVRARLALGDAANLMVTERDAESSTPTSEAIDVEMTITNGHADSTDVQLRRFTSHRRAPIRIGSHIADAEISVPNGCVEIGTAAEVTLVAPLTIECAELRLSADRLVIETAPRELFATSVFLRADHADTTVPETPIVRGRAILGVHWPHSKIIPMDARCGRDRTESKTHE